MGAFDNYSTKVPTITNVTLTLANTWYKIIDADTSIRKWRMKARESTDNSYDYAYNDAAPTLYMTNSGSGTNFDNTALPTVYARSATAGTIIELEYWS